MIGLVNLISGAFYLNLVIAVKNRGKLCYADSISENLKENSGC